MKPKLPRKNGYDYYNNNGDITPNFNGLQQVLETRSGLRPATRKMFQKLLRLRPDIRIKRNLCTVMDLLVSENPAEISQCLTVDEQVAIEDLVKHSTPQEILLAAFYLLDYGYRKEFFCKWRRRFSAAKLERLEGVHKP